MAYIRWLLDRLPSPIPVPGAEITRTLGVARTPVHRADDAADVGYIEVNTAIGGSGRLMGGNGWADIANLYVEAAHRRHAVETRLLAEVGDWLRLARVPRLLAYATPDEVEHRAFLDRHGFRLLTRTHREWRLPIRCTR